MTEQQNQLYHLLLRSSCICATPHPPTVPTVTASINSPTAPFTAGQSYTLTCTATVTGGGGETLSTNTTISWTHPNGSVTSGTGSSLDLTLNPLRVSDAGQYTCNVSVSSPFLTGTWNSTDTFTINVQGKLFLSVNVCYFGYSFYLPGKKHDNVTRSFISK